LNRQRGLVERTLGSDMDNLIQKRKIILGDEYDDALRKLLMSVLKKMGGQPRSKEWGVGGSQELHALEVGIGGRAVLVESESYIGLSITGDEALVEEIAGLVAVHRGQTGLS